MTAAARFLIALAAGLVLASEAAACTVMFLEPEGQRRADLNYQRRLRADADAVFLARARPMAHRGGTMLDAVTGVTGDGPPSRVFLPADPSDCMPRPAPRGLVIAFARQIRPADAPWKVWTWGRWAVVAEIRPSEVVDPDLAAALRAAAGRLRE